MERENVLEYANDIKDCVKQPILNIKDVSFYTHLNTKRAKSMIDYIREKYKDYYNDKDEVFGKTEIASIHLLKLFLYI